MNDLTNVNNLAIGGSMSVNNDGIFNEDVLVRGNLLCEKDIECRNLQVNGDLSISPDTEFIIKNLSASGAISAQNLVGVNNISTSSLTLANGGITQTNSGPPIQNSLLNTQITDLVVTGSMTLPGSIAYEDLVITGGNNISMTGNAYITQDVTNTTTQNQFNNTIFTNNITQNQLNNAGTQNRSYLWNTQLSGTTTIPANQNLVVAQSATTSFAGVSVTPTQLSYVSGATSNLQNQLNGILTTLTGMSYTSSGQKTNILNANCSSVTSASATITSLTAPTLTSTTATLNSATITSLTAPSTSVTNFNATTSTVQTQNVTNETVTNLTVTNGIVATNNGHNLGNTTIGNLTIQSQATIPTLTCASSTITNASITNITNSPSIFGVLTANSNGHNFGNTTITNLTVSTRANIASANITSSNIASANITTITNSPTITGVITASANGHTFGNSNIANLNVTSSAIIPTLNSTFANITTGNITTVNSSTVNVTTISGTTMYLTGAISASSNSHVFGKITSTNGYLTPTDAYCQFGNTLVLSDLAINGNLIMNNGSKSITSAWGNITNLTCNTFTCNGNITASQTGHTFGKISCGNAQLSQATFTGNLNMTNNAAIVCGNIVSTGTASTFSNITVGGVNLISKFSDIDTTNNSQSLRLDNMENDIGELQQNTFNISSSISNVTSITGSLDCRDFTAANIFVGKIEASGPISGVSTFSSSSITTGFISGTSLTTTGNVTCGNVNARGFYGNVVGNISATSLSTSGTCILGNGDDLIRIQRNLNVDNVLRIGYGSLLSDANDVGSGLSNGAKCDISGNLRVNGDAVFNTSSSGNCGIQIIDNQIRDLNVNTLLPGMQDNNNTRGSLSLIHTQAGGSSSITFGSAAGGWDFGAIQYFDNIGNTSVNPGVVSFQYYGANTALTEQSAFVFTSQNDSKNNGFGGSGVQDIMVLRPRGDLILDTGSYGSSMPSVSNIANPSGVNAESNVLLIPYYSSNATTQKKVGVGTMNPTALLDVNGSAKFGNVNVVGGNTCIITSTRLKLSSGWEFFTPQEIYFTAANLTINLSRGTTSTVSHNFNAYTASTVTATPTLQNWEIPGEGQMIPSGSIVVWKPVDNATSSSICLPVETDGSLPRNYVIHFYVDANSTLLILGGSDSAHTYRSSGAIGAIRSDSTNRTRWSLGGYNNITLRSCKSTGVWIVQ